MHNKICGISHVSTFYPIPEVTIESALSWELIANILSQCSDRDIKNASLVNKYFKNISLVASEWKRTRELKKFCKFLEEYNIKWEAGEVLCEKSDNPEILEKLYKIDKRVLENLQLFSKKLTITESGSLYKENESYSDPIKEVAHILKKLPYTIVLSLSEIIESGAINEYVAVCPNTNCKNFCDILTLATIHQKIDELINTKRNRTEESKKKSCDCHLAQIAFSLYQFGFPNEVERIFDTVTNRESINCILAGKYAYKGDIEKFSEYLEKIETDESRQAVIYETVWIWISNGKNLDKALEYALKISSVSSKNIVLKMMANRYEYIGRPEIAEDIRRCISISPLTMMMDDSFRPIE